LLKNHFYSYKFFLAITLSIANAKEPRQVTVATVDNHIITAQDVLNATNRLPKKIKEKSLSEIYPNVVNELINQHLITQQAYKDKLDQQKEIIEILKKNKDQIMAKYWLNNFLANNTSEEKIQDFYTKYLENFKTFKEFNANHILVKEENKALQIIEKLKIKSEFSKLAKSYSIGPSKKNGGSLGWFRSGQMVEEFEKAVLKLKKGETTKTS
jgi:peptidyl-prolyl cis-trans isomerase C